MKNNFTLFILLVTFFTVKSQIIVIDPGHGYDSNGGNPDGRSATEHSTSLEAGLRLRDLINDDCADWTAYMTRSTTNGWISLSQRSSMSNSWNADFYLSIHCNAGGGSGTETFWCDLNDSDNSDDILMAKKIQANMVSHGNWIDRRVVEDDAYIFHLAVLRYSNATGCLNEIGFVDSNDANKLNSSAYRDSFALAYLRAFEALLGNCTNSVSSLDVTPPTTQLSVTGNWQTQNFVTTFTDADNTGGSGLEKSYYQVIDYDGIEWRANSANGFFADNFDTWIHPDWSDISGTWSIANSTLVQSDEANGNSNIHAQLNQSLSNRYLYHFVAKIDGSGTSRRAGFHFMCDNPDSSHRGNSYFVWIKPDQSKLAIFKVVNNSFTNPVQEVALTTVAGQWYDYKVIYDRITGKMSVYQDNALITTWTDSSPIATGTAISFRSSNCNFAINELKVYRSRLFSSANVSVGGTTKDLRYQNSSPTSAAGKIKSICVDVAGNLSTINAKNINVDWTAPTSIDSINDGTGADISVSTSANSLSANWSNSSDLNSGIAKYYYAIGTTPGGTDVKNWTSTNTSTSVTATGLSLVNGQTYYFSIKAENGAGLQSAAYTSNGQTVQTTTSIIEHTAAHTLHCYPNPFTNEATLTYELTSSSKVEVAITDVVGKEIKLYTNNNQQVGKHQVMIHSGDLNLSAGMYLVRLRVNTVEHTTKVVVK